MLLVLGNLVEMLLGNLHQSCETSRTWDLLLAAKWAPSSYKWGAWGPIISRVKQPQLPIFKDIYRGPLAGVLENSTDFDTCNLCIKKKFEGMK